jgi:hypothetical protein
MLNLLSRNKKDPLKSKLKMTKLPLIKKPRTKENTRPNLKHKESRMKRKEKSKD